MNYPLIGVAVVGTLLLLFVMAASEERAEAARVVSTECSKTTMYAVHKGMKLPVYDCGE